MLYQQITVPPNATTVTLNFEFPARLSFQFALRQRKLPKCTPWRAPFHVVEENRTGVPSGFSIPPPRNLIVAVLFLVKEVISGIRHKRLITHVR